MRVLGIDPGGVIGGCGVIETSSPFDSCDLLDTIPLPIVGTGAKRRLHVVYLFNWLRKWKPEKGWIERAGAFPGQGVSSSFLYGRTTGALEAVCMLAGITLATLEPSVWKAAMGLPGGASKGLDGQPIGPAKAKALARERALAMWPDKADLLTTHGRAESCLIAFYGAEHGAPIATEAGREQVPSRQR